MNNYTNFLCLYFRSGLPIYCTKTNHIYNIETHCATFRNQTYIWRDLITLRSLQLVQHIKHCVFIFGHLIFECFTHSHLDYRQQSSHVIHTSPYSQHTRSRVALQHTSKHVLRGAISRSTMCMWFDWCDCVGGSIISHVMVDETIICERDPTHTRPHVSELL